MALRYMVLRYNRQGPPDSVIDVDDDGCGIYRITFIPQEYRTEYFEVVAVEDLEKELEQKT